MIDSDTLVSLSAVLIVKNEADQLRTCLASLAGKVDAVFVYDTGSTDDTVALARAAGATVVEGNWTDDFAAARNAAAALATTEWVLSIDADEQLIADGSFLRAALLTTSADALAMTINVEHDEAPYDFPAVRLFRPLVAQWSGAVHEQLVALNGSLEVETLASDVARIQHAGYRTADQRAARAERNIGIAQATISDGSDGTALARSHVDLGRSFLSLREPQKAADAFEYVRANFPGTREYTEATDFFARLLIAEEMYPEALVVINQLSEAAATAQYCDWLAAQALVQMGRFADAQTLLRGVDRVVDTSGRQHAPAALAGLKSLVDQLCAVNP